MAETMAAKKRRVAEIMRQLRDSYPDAKCALHFQTPLQLLIATILSAQCTDERVNQVTPILFKKFPDARALAAAKLSEIEKIIRPTGFFKNKAKNIKNCCQSLVADYGGEVPQGMDELVALAGVGRKTANVVRGVIWGLADGVVVDTHVLRLSFRLGLADADNPIAVEKELVALLPQSDWIDYSHLLITHGRRTCKARKPACEDCFLFELCPRRGVD